MPSGPTRKRRVRILLAVFLLIIIAVVYTRRTPQGEFYPNVLQGSAGLRNDGQHDVVQELYKPVEAAQVKDEDKKVVPVTTTAAATSTTTQAKVEETGSVKPKSQSDRKVPSDGDVIEDGYEDEIHKGRKEVEIPAKDVTSSKIHWSLIKENFPITSTIQLPTATSKPFPRIQFVSTESGKIDQEKVAAVKSAAKHAWGGYRKLAMGADEIKPISGNSSNPFNGWGATLVDSLDTLWIMNMTEAFEEAVEAVQAIDFTFSVRPDIPLFETTIRYLGGLVAAYDISGQKYRTLLDKAVELADILYGAFDTPNRIPETYYRWKPAFASQPHRASNRIILAELGTLSLEFTRLAQLTHEPKFYDAIARITDALEEWQNNTRVPGMWPIKLDGSGCMKPLQEDTTEHSAYALVPGGDGEEMVADFPVHAEAKIKSSQQRLREDVLMQKPGTGRILGFDNPIPEGSLDSQDSRKALLGIDQEIKEPSRPALSGGRIIGFGDPLQEGSLDEKSLEEVQAFARPSLEGASPNGSPSTNTETHSKQSIDDASLDGKSREDIKAPAKRPASAGKIIGFGNPIEEGSLDGKSLEEIVKTNPQISKREESDDMFGNAICIPQGLASSYHKGIETFTLGGMSDSTYEYLPKQYMLLGGTIEQYKSMYLASAEAEIKKLLFRPMTPENLDILISGVLITNIKHVNGSMVESLVASGEHLTCFAGGMFAMGGKLFNRPQDIEIGRKLTDGCIWAYNSTATGIMPEQFTVAKCEDLHDCAWNQTKYWALLDPDPENRPDTAQTKVKSEVEIISEQPSHEKRQLDDSLNDVPAAPIPSLSDELDSVSDIEHPNKLPKQSLPLFTEEFVRKKIKEEHLPPGFVSIESTSYILRPEAIESVFYMYRITGEQYWRDMGWQMFQAIEKHTHATYGHSALDDVTEPEPKQVDTMESFWLAETLKYFYLLFDDKDTWSLDDWVLNTEAHFFRRPPYEFAD